jgi:hypothetical protein
MDSFSEALMRTKFLLIFSTIALYAIVTFLRPGPGVHESLVGGLVPVEKRLAAPGLTLRNLSGQAVDLSEYAGKVVLLGFWSTG